jgi:hypothetical protein
MLIQKIKNIAAKNEAAPHRTGSFCFSPQCYVVDALARSRPTQWRTQFFSSKQVGDTAK